MGHLGSAGAETEPCLRVRLRGTLGQLIILRQGKRPYSVSSHMFEPPNFGARGSNPGVVARFNLEMPLDNLLAPRGWARSSRLELSKNDRERSVVWRDAVRGARWGLEYLDLPRDILASELTSQ